MVSEHPSSYTFHFSPYSCIIKGETRLVPYSGIYFENNYYPPFAFVVFFYIHLFALAFVSRTSLLIFTISSVAHSPKLISWGYYWYTMDAYIMATLQLSLHSTFCCVACPIVPTTSGRRNSVRCFNELQMSCWVTIG